MPAPIFIGDELTAAGYRLAGADVRVCDPADAPRELARARETAELVLIAATHAARVPPGELGADPPLVVVVGDAQHGAPPDVAERVRRELGVLP